MNKPALNKEDLQGQIQRVTYTHEDTDYAIVKIKVKGLRDLVTVIGNIPSPLVGQVLKMKGEWANHPKYGKQFKAAFCECAPPTTTAGIQKYLASGLIKGIGPATAKKIVKLFGDKTLDIIEYEAKRLNEIDGIGQKRVEMIEKAWIEQAEIRNVMMFLQGHGVSAKYASKIFKTYGQDSIQIVQENPYRLATDVFGIGFITADEIAQKLGFDKESVFRVQAGILYVLHQLSNQGHVYYPAGHLVEKASEILEVEGSRIKGCLGYLVLEDQIVMDDLGDPEAGEDYRAVYLSKFYFAETQIAHLLKRLRNSPKSLPSVDADKALDWVQQTYSIDLADKQKDAVKKALLDKILVITGGPGTGKSFLLDAILKIISQSDAKIMLAAPTGRAAKRMNESTGFKAKTIHRLLEFDFKKGCFKRNAEHPLNCDLLIVDEMSMVDTVLMHHLLKALKADTTLIMVGDVNQLPSVGAGSVLKDIISSGAVPVVELTEIFRQAKKSAIVLNAHLVNNGHLPTAKTQADNLDDFYFIQQEDPERVLETIKKLVMERIPKRFDCDPLEDIQVLSPMNRGVVGVKNLNAQLQACLNPKGKELNRGGYNFRVGDKVMQIKNNYDKDVFNGDIGKIVSINTETQEVNIKFDGRDVAYDYTDLDELVLAYAISIHKSQGSDYPVVIIPVLTQHYIMLQRNLIYTGITRGKKLVVMVGSSKAMDIAVKNETTKMRYTYLAERLQ